MRLRRRRPGGEEGDGGRGGDLAWVGLGEEVGIRFIRSRLTGQPCEDDDKQSGREGRN